jgi:hypothetical protein
LVLSLIGVLDDGAGDLAGLLGRVNVLWGDPLGG